MATDMRPIDQQKQKNLQKSNACENTSLLWLLNALELKLNHNKEHASLLLGKESTVSDSCWKMNAKLNDCMCLEQQMVARLGKGHVP